MREGIRGKKWSENRMEEEEEWIENNLSEVE